MTDRERKYSPEIRKQLDIVRRDIHPQGCDIAGEAEKLLEEGERLDDAYLITSAYYRMAELQFQDTSSMENAFDLLCKAAEWGEKAEDYDKLVSTYILFGILTSMHKNYPLSFDYLVKAERNAEKSSNRDWYLGMVNANKAMIYHHVRDTERAVLMMEKSIEMMGKNPAHTNYEKNMVSAYIAAGHWYLDLNRCAEAEEAEKKIRAYRGGKKWNWVMEFELNCLDIHIASQKGDCKKVMDLVCVVLPVMKKNSGFADIYEDMSGLLSLMIRMKQYEACEEIIRILEERYSGMAPASREIFYGLEIRYYEMCGQTQKMNETAYKYYLAAIGKQKDIDRASRFAIQISIANEKMGRENVRLEQEAKTDVLTGLANRRQLDRSSQHAFEEAVRNGQNFAVEIMDVDYFKQYNDTYGHQAGDRCLKIIADVIRENIAGRDSILTARYGGDEIALIFRDVPDEEIKTVAEGINRGVREYEIPHEASESDTIVTVSQGIFSCVPREGDSLWDYFSGADAALYEVKRSGKGTSRIVHPGFSE